MRDLGRFPQLTSAAFPLSLAAILSIALAGCFTSKQKSDAITPFPGGTPPAQTSSATGYDLDTPIERIAADPKGAAVLNKDIPGLLTNSNYAMFKGMNLKTLATLSHGKLDDETLAQTKTDLAALPKQASLNR